MSIRSRSMRKRYAIFLFLLTCFHLHGWDGLQLTHVIAEKEKKSSGYKDNKLDALSDEKQAKIKKFAREYIHKVLHRLEKGKRRPPDSGSGGSAQSHHDANTATPPLPPLPPLSTPSQQGEEGGDAERDIEMEMEMSVEEAMDLSADEDDLNGGDADADEDDEPTPVEPAESDTSTAVASAPTPSSAPAPADPRLRARATAAAASFVAASVESKDKGWEMLGLSFESSTTAAS
jgi:hypothetical protein